MSTLTAFLKEQQNAFPAPLWSWDKESSFAEFLTGCLASHGAETGSAVFFVGPHCLQEVG